MSGIMDNHVEEPVSQTNHFCSWFISDQAVDTIFGNCSIEEEEEGINVSDLGSFVRPEGLMTLA